MSNTVPRPKLRAHADSITAVPVEDEPLFYPRPASRHRVRWGLITTGMLTILLPLLLCQFTVLPWFSSLWGRFQHGDPPTYQVDQPLDGIQTHFVATNWHRRIDIIEYMGEGGRVVVYSGGLVSSDQDSVALQFVRKGGKLYMLLYVDGVQATEFVYVGQGMFKIIA